MVEQTKEPKKYTIHDYDFMQSVGEGAFGVVYLVKEKETG